MLQNVILKRAGKTRKLENEFRHITPEELSKGFNPKLDYYLRTKFDLEMYGSPEELYELDMSKIIGKLINLHQNKYGDIVADIDFDVQSPMRLSDEIVKCITADQITGLGTIEMYHDLNDKNLIHETNFKLLYAVLNFPPPEAEGLFMAA